MDNLQQLQDSQKSLEPELTIHDYWLILNRGKLWIICSVIIMLACSIYYNYSVSPKYTATATLLIDKGSDADAIFGFSGSLSQSELSNQIELLKSRQVATESVKSLWESKNRNNLAIFSTRKFLPRGQRPRRLIREIITFGFYDPEAAKSDHFDEEYSEINDELLNQTLVT